LIALFIDLLVCQLLRNIRITTMNQYFNLLFALYCSGSWRVRRNRRCHL